MLILKTCFILAAIPNYHSLDGLDNKHLFFTALEAGSPRSVCWHDKFLAEALFLVTAGHRVPMLMKRRAERERERETKQAPSSYNGASPINEGSTS